MEKRERYQQVLWREKQREVGETGKEWEEEGGMGIMNDEVGMTIKAGKKCLPFWCFHQPYSM